MTIDLKAIRAAAEAAPYEAPWRYEPIRQTVWAGNTYMVADIRGWGHLQYLPNGKALQDATGVFIATANPAAILELLDRLEAAEKALAEPAVEPVKGLFVDLIAQHPGLAEELAAIVIDAPPAEPSIPNHQASLLAHALAECIVASGIVRKDIAGFSAPQLLLFAGDLKRMLDAQEAERALQKPPPAEPARTSQDVCTVPLLSDDEMWQLWNAQGDDAMDQVSAIAFARAIEQLVRRKAGL